MAEVCHDRLAAARDASAGFQGAEWSLERWAYWRGSILSSTVVPSFSGAFSAKATFTVTIRVSVGVLHNASALPPSSTRPFLVPSLCLCGYRYVRNIKAGSMVATRRKDNMAAPRHMSTVPRSTAKAKPGEIWTLRYNLAMAGRRAQESTPPNAEPSKAAITA